MRIGPAFLQTFTSQGLQSAASIATGILIARALGPTVQGRYALFAAAVMLGGVLASLGQFEGNVITSAGRAESGRLMVVRSLLHGTGVLVLGIGCVMVPRPANPGPLDGLGLLFGIVLSVEVMAQLLRGISLGQHHITAYAVTTLLQRCSYLALAVVLTVAGRLTLTAILGAWAAAGMLSVCVGSAWAWRRSPKTRVDWRVIGEGWGTKLRQGSRALLTIALTMLLIRCDVWMLGPMLSFSAVGQMSIASSLAEWLWYVPSVLGNVLFAAVAAEGADAALPRIARASRSVVALVVPVALILLVIGRGLVRWIYGVDYTSGGTLFLFLVPGMCAIAIHLVVDAYFAGRGFPPISIWSALGALSAKVGLNLLVIPSFGAAGAAVSTSAVYLGLLAVKVVAVQRETGIRISTLLCPTRRDLADNVMIARRWVARRIGLAHG